MDTFANWQQLNYSDIICICRVGLLCQQKKMLTSQGGSLWMEHFRASYNYWMISPSFLHPHQELQLFTVY